MYHILIVDDEFLVRLGLKTTIDWTAHGYKVVGEAANGKEALELVQTLKPDIVLVDIKMPLIDGLSFITEAKKLNQDISFIIFSNYESFQYAKRAMHLGVSQYLLKSEINADTLLATLESVKLERNSVKSKHQDINQARHSYLSRNLSKTQINTYISSEYLEAPPEEIFPAARYIVVKYFLNISLMNEQSIDMLGKMMVSLIEDEFPDSAYTEVIYQMHYYMTFIYPVTITGMSESDYLSKSNSISRKLKYYFSVVLKGGISQKGSAKEIPQLLSEAERARQQCFFEPINFVVYNRKLHESIQQNPHFHISSSRISENLEKREKDKIKDYIHSVFTELKKLKCYSCVHHTFIDFLSIAKTNLEKLNFEGMDNISNKLYYDNWNILASVDETESYICDIFDSILDVRSRTGSSYSASVKRAVAYIEENYASNITLDEIAGRAEISRSYLSMLFKQETGTNLVTYLNQYRIEKGKKLLTATNLKIYEIADTIGFGSPYYFSKVFKEITGMQCKEFRDTFSEVNH